MNIAHLIRRVCVLALAGTILFISSAAFAQPSGWTGPKKRGRKYKVRIDSAPQQAALYLESEEHGIVGYTPWDGRLAKGEWTIIVKKQGYETTSRKITVKRRSATQESFLPMVKKDMPGILELRGDADASANGAKVYVDGQLQGGIPVTISVKQGRHLVEIKKEGYEVIQQWLEVAEGSRQSMNPMMKKVVAKEVGAILVNADVTGAVVLLDGNQLKDTTPLMLNNVPAGAHVVEVRKPPAMPWRQSIEVKAGETLKITAQLQATMATGGTIRVLANVDGATVLLDGKAAGNIPAELRNVAPGAHLVQVQADGYVKVEREVTVAEGSASVLRLSLQRGGEATLRITSSVPEATVFVDGEKIGTAPQTREVAAGEHFVVVEKDGYQKFEKKLVIKKGAKTTISAELKASGGVRFISNPPNAEVFVDGRSIGNTPLESQLSVGQHVIAVRMTGYFESETRLDVKGGKVAIVNSTLKMIDTGPSTDELSDRQKGLTSYGARTLPAGNSTIDIAGGYPYFLDARITVGAGEISEGISFDAGFLVRSFFSRTELGLLGRLTLLNQSPFSFGTFLELGGGSNFVDDSKRNSAFMRAGGIASLTGLGAVTITGRAYLDMWSDRHCPSLNSAGNGYSEADADGIEVCDEYLAGTLDGATMSRIDNYLLDGPGSMFKRDFGVRAIFALFVEVAVTQHWNAWLMFEGAPFQDERAAYTDLFNRAQLEEDVGSYFRLGGTYKF